MGDAPRYGCLLRIRGVARAGRSSLRRYGQSDREVWGRETLDGAEEVRITITIEDTGDGQVNVSETREAGDGEAEASVTSATALVDAMFEVMDQLGEVAVV